MAGDRASNNALAIYEAIKNRLFTDDVQAKKAMFQQLANTFADQSFLEREDVLKEYYQLLSDTVTEMADHLTSFVDALMAIHVQNNIDLPEYLLAYEEKATAKPYPEKPVEEIDVPSGPTDAEKLTALEKRLEALRARIMSAFSDIQLTKSARLNAGFLPFKNAFGRGFKIDGIPGTFARIDTDHAKQLFDTLFYVSTTATQTESLTRAQQMLRIIETVELELSAELDELKAFVAQHNLSRLKQLDWPTIFPFSDRLADIKQAWPHIERLVQDHWPANGEATAEAVRELLFSDPYSQPEAVMDEAENKQPKRLTEAEARAFVDEHLNEVLFPYGRTITEEEVRGAAQRAGFTKRQMEDLEWERVRDLATIRDIMEGKLYDAKAGEKFLGNEVPYFIVLFEHDGETYAVAESPIKESATYVVKGNSWSEVLKAPRRVDARRLGAEYIIHSAKSPFGDEHVVKIMNKVLEICER